MINNVVIGFILGILFMVILSYLFPKNIRAVNEELVKLGMAYYNKNNGDIIWIEKEGK